MPNQFELSKARRLAGQPYPADEQVIIPRERPSKYVVNWDSSVQCAYCNKPYAVSAMGSHLNQSCQLAIRAKGKNPEEVLEHKKAVRKQTREKQSLNVEYRKKDSYNRLKNNLLKKAPKENKDDPIWLSVSSTHPMYWNPTELPQLGDGNIRVDVIKKILPILESSLDTYNTVRETRNKVHVFEHKANSLKQLKDNLATFQRYLNCISFSVMSLIICFVTYVFKFFFSK